MPRTIRIQFQGAIYHIYSRGNEKKDIFKDDNDRSRFMHILTRVKERLPFELHAYALMPNHYHLLITTPYGNVGKIMQAINSPYASFFNWKYKRVGHLYQSTYKSILVDDDPYFIDLTRYIHLNPSALLNREKLESFKWSSFRQYIDPAAKGPADTDKLFSLFGCRGKVFSKRYALFLAEGGKISDERIRMDMFDKIAVGKEEFIEKIKDEFIKKGKKIPKKLRRQETYTQERVLESVCKVFSVNKAEIARKQGRTNYAKKAAVYLLYAYTTFSEGEVCALFGGIHRSCFFKTLKSAKEEIETGGSLSLLVSKVERELKGS